MKKNNTDRPIPARKRLLLKLMLVLAVVSCMGGAFCLPFFFESSTMYYKFGIDKTLLRSAKLIGLAASVLLLIQLPLASRLKWLDRLFSLPGLYGLHRNNAYIIGILAVIHPVLILAPERRWYPLMEARYWPEWIGVALLAAIWVQILTTRWHRRVFPKYQLWRATHYSLGAVIALMMIFHILYASETFEESGPPRYLVFAATVGWVLLWLWIRGERSRRRNREFKVIGVSPAGSSAYCIDVAPAASWPHFNYMPGQFAFLSFDTPAMTREAHPFTISSSPSRPGSLQFIIRDCGDWTHLAGSVKKGDSAVITGPFGQFSHLFYPVGQEIIMIAGGIGITPMLSMLRHLSDTGDARPITLIWANRTRAQLFAKEELNSIGEKLTTFHWLPIFTEEKGDGGNFTPLNRIALERHLQDHRRDAVIFLCGPPPMMKQVQKDLLFMGFPNKSIQTEAFGF